MAGNNLYDNARELFLTKGIHWETDNVKVMLVNIPLYSFRADHKYLNDINGSARNPVGPVALMAKSATSGAASANDVTFTSVSGDPIGALILYMDTGDERTSPLIAYIDAATGLPITPNGGDIIINWDKGVNKIFRV